MTDDQTQNTTRGGFLGFMRSVPGVLTALAAVLTAAGGAYVAVHKGNDPAATPPRYNINLTVQPNQAAPSSDTSVNAGSVDLQNTSQTSISAATSSDAVDQCSQGSEAACETVLEDLISGCYGGEGSSCDLLYEVSPTGSELESYAATCGYRFADDTYADSCEYVGQ